MYAKTAGSMLIGGHCVRLIGWGDDGGTPYWLVANEWSTSWGEGGFFRIHRTANGVSFGFGLAAGQVLV